MSLFAVHILRFMNAAPDVMGYAVVYFRIMAVNQIPVMLTMILHSILRATGDTRTPLYNNTLALTLHIGCNYILINGIWLIPPLGIVGAALAATISRTVSLAIAMMILVKRKDHFRIDLRYCFAWHKENIRRILQIGTPAAIERMVMHGGSLQFSRNISSLGTHTFAAHQAALDILGMSQALDMGLQDTSTAFVGQALGGGGKPEAKRLGDCLRNFGQIKAGFVFLFFLLGGNVLVRIYTSDPSVIASATLVLRIISFAQFAQASAFILSGALRSVKDTKWPLYTSLAGIWGGRVLLSYIFINLLGLSLAGAWLALGIDLVICGFLLEYRWRRLMRW